MGREIVNMLKGQGVIESLGNRGFKVEYVVVQKQELEALRGHLHLNLYS